MKKTFAGGLMFGTALLAGGSALQAADVTYERLQHPDTSVARRARGVAWARRFTWTRFADELTAIYVEVARATESARSPRSEPCPA